MGILLKSKVIFRRIKGRIVPISAKRMDKTKSKLRKHLGRKPKLLNEKRHAAVKFKKISADNAKKKARNTIALGTGLFSGGVYAGYREGRTYRVKGK